MTSAAAITVRLSSQVSRELSGAVPNRAGDGTGRRDAGPSTAGV